LLLISKQDRLPTGKDMTEKKNIDGWVYVFVSGPEGSENFLGLYDEEKDVNFIPAFDTKEAAQDCYLSLPREKGKKYEVQAVHVEELRTEANKNGFVVALVDQEGKILRITGNTDVH
jgi:hypothetical protein